MNATIMQLFDNGGNSLTVFRHTINVNPKNRLCYNTARKVPIKI